MGFVSPGCPLTRSKQVPCDAEEREGQSRYSFCAPEQTSGAVLHPWLCPAAMRSLPLVSSRHVESPMFPLPGQQSQNTKQLPRSGANQTGLGGAGSCQPQRGLFPLQNLPFSVGQSQQVSPGPCCEGLEINLFTAGGLGSLQHGPGKQRQAASLGSGSKRDSLLPLKVVPLFHHSSCCSSFLPCVLVARWMLAVSRKKTGCWVTFSAQAAVKWPWENDSRKTQPSHLAAVLSSAVTLSFFPSPQSGGRIITLEGRGFVLVQNVSMVVRGIGREQTVGVPAGCCP